MRALLWLPLALTGCASATRPAVAPVDAAPAVRGLPEGWDLVPASAFEERVAALNGREVRWSADGLLSLAAALELQDAVSARAAVLLGHDRGAGATAVLLARLEQRQTAPARGLEAGDLIAAAALDRAGVDDALVALVRGPRPHPVLEVRVECARSALRAGREEVVPFLLTVLRALTPAEREHPADWERIETMMWVKSRAGEALSDRLGIQCQVRPDGSWVDQMAEADRLEQLFFEQR